MFREALVAWTLIMFIGDDKRGVDCHASETIFLPNERFQFFDAEFLFDSANA